jgi:hypothetical protein
MRHKNIEQLLATAQLLRPLLKDLVFVGGSVTGLLITDKAASEPRTTYDVDAISHLHRDATAGHGDWYDRIRDQFRHQKKRADQHSDRQQIRPLGDMAQRSLVGLTPLRKWSHVAASGVRQHPFGWRLLEVEQVRFAFRHAGESEPDRPSPALDPSEEMPRAFGTGAPPFRPPGPGVRRPEGLLPGSTLPAAPSRRRWACADLAPRDPNSMFYPPCSRSKDFTSCPLR